jgi:hypothetical protein
LTSIENVTGSGGSDYIIGSAVANSIVGGTGNDTIQASAGADTLTGGDGVDTLRLVQALSGTLIADNAAINLATTTAQTLSTGNTITLATFESIDASGQLNSAVDLDLTGTSAANTLTGGAGSDTFTGSGGVDTFVVNYKFPRYENGDFYDYQAGRRKVIFLFQGLIPFLKEKDIRLATEGESYADKIEKIKVGLGNYFEEVNSYYSANYSKFPFIVMAHLYVQGVESSESEREIQIGNQDKKFLDKVLTSVHLISNINCNISGGDVIRYRPEKKKQYCLRCFKLRLIGSIFNIP